MCTDSTARAGELKGVVLDKGSVRFRRSMGRQAQIQVLRRAAGAARLSSSASGRHQLTKGYF
jgi:predicted site-specific integrase-resolvase